MLSSANPLYGLVVNKTILSFKWWFLIALKGPKDKIKSPNMYPMNIICNFITLLPETKLCETIKIHIANRMLLTCNSHTSSEIVWILLKGILCARVPISSHYFPRENLNHVQNWSSTLFMGTVTIFVKQTLNR